ncbi:CidA/LrgA family protein [Oceanobacillus saliphilus]|uniref:CidA/LrgA family protein n=1 Tax=Oceanobacillus saliphilus TaxID=2925834 RepID=UPI00201D41FF|nr:CidA/LrgA family protein [Oceanobacillus saliphilus]
MLRLDKVILHIVILYVIFLIGDWIQQTLNLFIPGSVVGMIILLILLLSNIIKLSWIEEGTKLFVNHLTLFFIPATVGVINYLEIFTGKGLLVIGIILVSTALVIGISAKVSQWIIRKKELQHE